MTNLGNDGEIGFLRLPQVLEIIPISKSAWFAGVRRGIYPKQVKLGGARTSAWLRADIITLCNELAGAAKPQKQGDMGGS